MDGDERTAAGTPVPTEAGRPAWRRVARRVLPPLRVGNVSLDLGFMVVFFVTYILMTVAQSLH